MTIGQTLNKTLSQDLIYTSQLEQAIAPVSFSILAVGLGTGLGTGVLIILITGVVLVAVLWTRHDMKKKYRIGYAIKAVKMYHLLPTALS